MDCGVSGSGDSPYINGMSTDQIMQLTYLVLLGAAIGGTAIVAGRSNMGKMAQQAAIWALIFVGVIGAYGLWEDISRDNIQRQALVDNGVISVPRGFDGHYQLILLVNDTPVDFIVDTGASQVVLSARDAARAGINPDALNYSRSAATANGIVRVAPVTLDSIALEGITDRDIGAVVNAGAMDQSLLGMSYLGQYTRIEIANDELVLTR